MKKGLLIAAAALMTLGPACGNAQRRVVVRMGGPYAGGWHEPYYGPIWRPIYAAPFTGRVKLDTKAKDAEVFINGSFAGLARERKTMYMRPGSYSLELRQGGRTLYAESIYVVGGKTLRIRPSL